MDGRDLVFERPPIEKVNDPDYDALRKSLEAEGWEVTEVASVERGHPAADVVEIFFRFLNDLGDDALHDAAGLLIGLLIARLLKPRRPGVPKRQATLYRPNGQVYKTIDLDEAVDDADRLSIRRSGSACSTHERTRTPPVATDELDRSAHSLGVGSPRCRDANGKDRHSRGSRIRVERDLLRSRRRGSCLPLR